MSKWRTYIITPEGDVEVPDLITYVYGSNDLKDWPAWFQVGERWARWTEGGGVEWTATNPWPTAFPRAGRTH